MRHRCFAIALFMALMCFCAFAAEDKDAGDEDDFSDIDSMFSEASDIIIERNENTGVSDVVSNALSAIATFPLKFSGSFSGQVGAAYKRSDDDDYSGYMNFENHLYFSARPVYELALYADILTSYDNGFDFELYQMYYDYNLWNHVFIGGGKRKFSWGFPHLFKSSGNIVEDAHKCVNSSIKFTYDKFNFTFMAMYPLIGIDSEKKIEYDIDEEPDREETSGFALSYVSALEFIVWETSINFFYRYWPDEWKFDEDTVSASVRKPGITYRYKPAYGLEVKRTFWGLDSYVQGMVYTDKFTNDTDKWQQYRGIAGFYGYWEAKYKIGFNFEYMRYHNNDINVTSDNSIGLGTVEKIGFYTGVSGFAKNHLAAAISVSHNITDECGMVTPGVILRNVFPSANLQTGLQFDYGKDKTLETTFGMKLVMKLDY